MATASDGHLAPARTWWRSTWRLIGLPALLIPVVMAGGKPCPAQTRPDFLAADIDSTVSPGDDFFQYANGAWLTRHPVPHDMDRWGMWNVAGQAMAERLRRISDDAAAAKAPRGSIEQLVGDFWFTGMDSAAINRQGLTPLKADFDRIGRIRSIKDLIDVVALFHTRDPSFGNALFFGHVEQDEKNSGRWIFSLRQSGLSLNGPGYYSAADSQRARVRAGLRECLSQTFQRLQQDSARAVRSAQAVYELEAQLARGFDRQDYRMIAIADLSRLAPTIDWHRYLRRIGAGSLDSVDMRSPRFFAALDSLLRTTPLEAWKDYLRFWLIRVNSPFLDDSTFGAFFAVGGTLTGALRPPERWQRVLSQERDYWLGEPLGTLYVQQYVPAAVHARSQHVGEALRAAFRERIAQLDWMSDSTKRSALRKLARLQITIGFPENGLEYGTMPLRRDAYVLNVIRASAWYHERDMTKLHKPVDRAAIDSRPSVEDGTYVDTNNEVIIRPGPLVSVPGLSEEELDDAVVYGASFLGHEISHAFDSGGREYDAEGNVADWWTARDDSAFQARAQVMVDEYNAFTPLAGMHVNGQRSLRENMADLVGLRVALDAFKQTEQYRRNERIGGFTPLQRFFLAYAFGRMGQERQENLVLLLRNGAYAPLRERVNGVVLNMPEFYEAFGVKPGDRMYRPEEARVKIW